MNFTLTQWLARITELYRLVGRWHELANAPHSNRDELTTIEQQIGWQVLALLPEAT